MSGFAPGDRVELVYTEDKFTKLKPGDRGTVQMVTGGTYALISVSWDSGSRLGILPEVDEIRKVD